MQIALLAHRRFAGVDEGDGKHGWAEGYDPPTCSLLVFFLHPWDPLFGMFMFATEVLLEACETFHATE